MTASRRIGISMRVVISAHGETRDALARDWPVLLERIGRRGGELPDWVMLPNIGQEAVGLARRLGVRGLLLTGGDDFGVTPDRDETEAALLDWAEQERLPVLGICRGAQWLARRAGMELAPLPRERHVAARHAVIWRTPDACEPFWMSVLPVEGTEERVNSWHLWGIGEPLPASLRAVAVCPDDGSVEALCHVSLPWLGLVWHPERESPPRDGDVAVLRRLFFLRAETSGNDDAE